MNNSQSARPIRHGQRGASAARDAVANFFVAGRDLAALPLHKVGDSGACALPQGASVNVNAAHARVSGERNKSRLVLGHFPSPQPVFFLRQHHHGPALRGFVRETCQLRRVSQFPLRNAVKRQELNGLAIAQRDSSGFVKQQSIHIAGSLHRLAAHREHVILHDPVHARNADSGKKTADGSRYQANQKRD